MDQLKVPYGIYTQILDTLDVPEKGGVLGMRGDILSHYFFDKKSIDPHCYRPTVSDVNREVNQWLKEKGVHFCGFIHSHPPMHKKLSPCDLVAAERNLLLNGLPYLYMGLLVEKDLLFFKIIHQHGAAHPTVEPCSVKILREFCTTSDTAFP